MGFPGVATFPEDCVSIWEVAQDGRPGLLLNPYQRKPNATGNIPTVPVPREVVVDVGASTQT
jgi:hypothetical protein